MLSTSRKIQQQHKRSPTISQKQTNKEYDIFTHQSPHSLASSKPVQRLVAVLYELLSPGRKFCTSFFQLGAALLDSCAASLQQGRAQCGAAAVDLAQLLGKALTALAEHELLGRSNLGSE